MCPEARLGDVRARIEDLVSILLSIPMRRKNPQGCTENVSFDKRTRGLGRGTYE